MDAGAPWLGSHPGCTLGAGSWQGWGECLVCPSPLGSLYSGCSGVDLTSGWRHRGEKSSALLSWVSTALDHSRVSARWDWRCSLQTSPASWPFAVFRSCLAYSPQPPPPAPGSLKSRALIHPCNEPSHSLVLGSRTKDNEFLQHLCFTFFARHLCIIRGLSAHQLVWVSLCQAHRGVAYRDVRY